MWFIGCCKRWAGKMAWALVRRIRVGQRSSKRSREWLSLDLVIIFDLSPKLSCILYQIIFRNFTTLAWPKWFLQRCGEKNPVEQIQWPGRLSCQIISCYWEGTFPFQPKNFVILLLLSDICLPPFLFEFKFSQLLLCWCDSGENIPIW